MSRAPSIHQKVIPEPEIGNAFPRDERSDHRAGMRFGLLRNAHSHRARRQGRRIHATNTFA